MVAWSRGPIDGDLWSVAVRGRASTGSAGRRPAHNLSGHRAQHAVMRERMQSICTKPRNTRDPEGFGKRGCARAAVKLLWRKRLSFAPSIGSHTIGAKLRVLPAAAMRRRFVRRAKRTIERAKRIEFTFVSARNLRLVDGWVT